MSASEALEAHLERIEKRNSALHAVVSLDPDRARRLARDADAALRRGEVRGPLHGVPMTLKDAHDIAGLRTTIGTEVLDRIAGEDGTVAARLRAAGAILIGHTNVAAWLADPAQSANPLFGRTANPWDTKRTAGGSSGGAAAALAAGMTPLEVGSDLAGSIRLPAHFCGVYGLKTTEHRVLFTGFFHPPDRAPQPVRILSCLGPMGRDLGDLQLALAIIAGPDGDDCRRFPWFRCAGGNFRVCAWRWRRRCPAPRSRERSGNESSAWQRKLPTPARESKSDSPRSTGTPFRSSSAIWPRRSPAFSTQLRGLRRPSSSSRDDDRFFTSRHRRSGGGRREDGELLGAGPPGDDLQLRACPDWPSRRGSMTRACRSVSGSSDLSGPSCAFSRCPRVGAGRDPARVQGTAGSARRVAAARAARPVIRRRGGAAGYQQSACRRLPGVKLDWDEARALRLARHHLHERAPRGGELRVAGRICGLHAQLLSSAALSLWARVEGATLDGFQRALWRERRLVKSWAMRGTLHLLPARDLPVFLGALATYDRYLTQRWVKYFGISREEIELVIEAIGQSLRGRALTRDELADAVVERTGSKKLGAVLRQSWGVLLEPAAYRGQLCFAEGEGARVRFSRPGPVRRLEPQKALAELARRYLAAYGPATRDDFARWWGGISGRQTERLIRSLCDRSAALGRPLSRGAERPHLPAAGMDLARPARRRARRGRLATRVQERPHRGADRAVRAPAAQGARGGGRGGGAAGGVPPGEARPPRFRRMTAKGSRNFRNFGQARPGCGS